LTNVAHRTPRALPSTEEKSPLCLWILNSSAADIDLFARYCHSVDVPNDFYCLHEILKLEQDKLVDKQRAAQTIIATHISPLCKISIEDPVLLQDLTRKATIGWNCEELFNELEIALVEILKKHWEKFMKRK